MIKKYFCFILCLLAIAGFGIKSFAQPANSISLRWFQDARYGMFIHWDMSSVEGIEISWSRKATKPLDVYNDPAGYVEDPFYDNLYKQFNPTQFNAAEWVALAKKAGMGYIVFTAKHHGGFCMWNTKTTDYSIMNTAFKRDVVKELSEACRKAGLKFGLYYSQRDWHHPDYGIGDNKKYIAYMNAQLTELLSNYGKIDIMWWDSYGTGDLEKFWQIGETYNLVKKLQPGIIMNNRMAVLAEYNKQPAPYLGDWDTPEQKIGKFQNTRLWESCMSIVSAPDGGGWSYRKDGTVRTYKECITALISCATGDGNLLLDVGPDATGKIPADQSARLLEMANWLNKYGQTVYGTRGGPYHNGAWGGATYKKNKIYLHVAKWNGNELKLPTLQSKVLKCRNLSNPASAPIFQQNENNIVITLPANEQDSINTIIELTLTYSAAREMKDGKPIMAGDK